MSYTRRVNNEATYRGKGLVHHGLHRHVGYALQLVVNNELWDELGLRESQCCSCVHGETEDARSRTCIRMTSRSR